MEDMNITMTLKEYKELIDKAMRYDMIRNYHVKDRSYLTDFERGIFDIWEDKKDE